MISRVIKKTVYLDAVQKVDQLDGPLYQLEESGHTFEITCMSGGTAAAVSGTVSGRFLRADETTVYFTGTLSGNVASLTLPQSCYSVNGRFGLVVFISGNDVTSAIYAVAGNVYRSTSETIIDPTGEIPSLEELIAQIEACEDATEAATNAAALMMPEVSDMNVSLAKATMSGIDSSKFSIGSGIRPNGTNTGSDAKLGRSGYISVSKPFVIKPASGTYKILVCAYTNQGTSYFVRNLTGSVYTSYTVVVPTVDNIAYIRIGFSRTDNADLTNNDISGIAADLQLYAYTDTTLSVSNASADAKAVGDRFANAETRIDSLEDGDIAGLVMPKLFNSTGSVLPEFGLNESATTNTTCTMWESVTTSGTTRVGPIIDMGSKAGRKYTGRRVYAVYAYDEDGTYLAQAVDSNTTVLHTFDLSETPHRYIRVVTLRQYRYEYDLVVGETIGASTHRGIVLSGVNREGLLTKRTFLRIGSLEPAATYQKYRMAFCEYTNNGVLLLGGESRYNNGDDNNDVSIVFRRSFDNGMTFTDPVLLFERNVDANVTYHAKGSGQFLVDRNTGRVFCFCMREDSNIDRVHGGLASKAEYDSSILYKYSDDDGATWSEENSIDLRTSEMMFMASSPSQGITMDDGTLVVPAFCKYAADGSYRSLLIYSTDHGENWTWSGVTVPESSNECTVVETNTPGTLMINCRDEAAPYRVVYTTSDLGATWTEHITNRYSLYNFKVEGHLKKVTLGGGNGSTVYLFSAPFGPIVNNMKTVTKIMCSYDLISWSEFCLVTSSTSRGYTMMAVYGDILNIVEEFGDDRLTCDTMHLNQAGIKATPLMIPAETEQLRRGQLYYDKTANKLKFIDANGATKTISFES